MRPRQRRDTARLESPWATDVAPAGALTKRCVETYLAHRRLEVGHACETIQTRPKHMAERQATGWPFPQAVVDGRPRWNLATQSVVRDEGTRGILVCSIWP